MRKQRFAITANITELSPHPKRYVAESNLYVTPQDASLAHFPESRCVCVCVRVEESENACCRIGTRIVCECACNCVESTAISTRMLLSRAELTIRSHYGQLLYDIIMDKIQ